MTLFTAHVDFPAGHALTNTDLNDRFNELKTILNGGLVDENVNSFTAAVIAGTAAVLTGTTQAWSIRNTFNGITDIGRLLAIGPVVFGDGDTSPSVGGNALLFETANTGATNLDDFDDGVAGQIIILQAGDANTTIRDTGGGTGNIRTGNGVDKTLAQRDIFAFIFSDAGSGLFWHELFRSNP